MGKYRRNASILSLRFDRTGRDVSRLEEEQEMFTLEERGREREKTKKKKEKAYTLAETRPICDIGALT